MRPCGPVCGQILWQWGRGALHVATKRVHWPDIDACTSGGGDLLVVRKSPPADPQPMDGTSAPIVLQGIFFFERLRHAAITSSVGFFRNGCSSVAEGAAATVGYVAGRDPPPSPLWDRDPGEADAVEPGRDQRTRGRLARRVRKRSPGGRSWRFLLGRRPQDRPLPPARRSRRGTSTGRARRSGRIACLGSTVGRRGNPDPTG